MQLAATAAQKTRNETKKLMSYSKQWVPGDTLRCLYPIFFDQYGKPQIAIGAVWGFPVNDMKKLGIKTVFIPSTNTFDGNGNPIEQPDITWQFSRMAPLFIAGEKQSKMNSIASKPYPDEMMRLQAYKKIEDEYSRDAKNPIKPVIGKCVYQITTECLSIKKSGNNFDPETIAISSRTMPDDLINKLYTIMNDSKYAPGPEDKFLEIEWKYPVNTEKSASGRAAVPAGLTPEYRLSVIDPDAWKAMQSRMNNVSTDSDSIVKRATYEVEMPRVRQAIQMYITNEVEWLECLTDEDEEKLIKSIDLIQELNVKRMLSKKSLITRIDEALAEAKRYSTSQPIVPPTVGSDAPKVEDLVAQQMANPAAAAGFTGTEAVTDSQANALNQQMAAMAQNLAQGATTYHAEGNDQQGATQQANATLQQAANLGVSQEIQNMMANPNNATNAMDTTVNLELDV